MPKFIAILLVGFVAGGTVAAGDLPIGNKAKRYCRNVYELSGFEDARFCVSIAAVMEKTCLRAEDFDACISKQITGAKTLNDIGVRPEPVHSEN